MRTHLLVLTPLEKAEVVHLLVQSLGNIWPGIEASHQPPTHHRNLALQTHPGLFVGVGRGRFCGATWVEGWGRSPKPAPTGMVGMGGLPIP